MGSAYCGVVCWFWLWCLGFSLWWLVSGLLVMFMCKFGLCFVVLFGLVVCLLGLCLFRLGFWYLVNSVVLGVSLFICWFGCGFRISLLLL